MNKNKIVLGEQETPVLSLRKKLVGLDDGLYVYSTLDKDEEDILIPFTVSLFVTSEKSKILLRKYVDDLGKGVCWESLGIDFGQMSGQAYWLKKCVKLKRDMEAMGVVPMKAHGFECTVLGFRPETTADLYRAIEANLMEIADLIKEVDRKLVKAPVALYGNYYRFLRGQYNEEQAVRDFYNWLRTSGIITLVKLRMLRAEKIADFINSGILRLALKSCDIEQDDVDVEQFKKQLPHDYPCVKDFDILCTIFNRTIGWQGDILIPNYNCAGLFIFQHWVELTEEQINAIFYLDKMLELIHGEIQDLPEAEKDPAPERGGELKDRLKKCIALLMDERYGDEPLFNQQSHWQAMYRILVDKDYCRDSDFDGFDTFIRTVMPDKVNKPYKKDSVKQISQTDFTLPFERWHYDPQTSTTRKPYDRMVAIATRFKQILEENGL